MRIQGVTGDLPAIAQLRDEGAPKVEQPTVAAAPPPVAAAAAASDTDAGGSSADRRRPPNPLPSFDPPLIAQRAVLGFPLGPMVAAHAAAEGITYGAAWVAVDRVMPRSAEPAQPS